MIEGFFSVCGIICNLSSTAIKYDLMQARYLLKSNFRVI